MIFSNPVQHQKYIKQYVDFMTTQINKHVIELIESPQDRIYMDIDLSINVNDSSVLVYDIHSNKYKNEWSFKLVQDKFKEMIPPIYVVDESFNRNSIYAHSLYITYTKPNINCNNISINSDTISDNDSLPELICASDSETDLDLNSNVLLNMIMAHKQKKFIFNDSDDENKIIKKTEYPVTDLYYSQMSYDVNDLTVNNNEPIILDMSDNHLNID